VASAFREAEVRSSHILPAEAGSHEIGLDPLLVNAPRLYSPGEWPDGISRQIRLQVTDNGVGLPSGFSDRASETLGLQLVRMLAKQLGGTVTFDGTGRTSVEVRVPMQGKTV
jgi:two-component sensor histidine kinase